MSSIIFSHFTISPSILVNFRHFLGNLTSFACDRIDEENNFIFLYERKALTDDEGNLIQIFSQFISQKIDDAIESIHIAYSFAPHMVVFSRRLLRLFYFRYHVRASQPHTKAYDFHKMAFINSSLSTSHIFLHFAYTSIAIQKRKNIPFVAVAIVIVAETLSLHVACAASYFSHFLISSTKSKTILVFQCEKGKQNLISTEKLIAKKN